MSYWTIEQVEEIIAKLKKETDAYCCDDRKLQQLAQFEKLLIELKK